MDIRDLVYDVTHFKLNWKCVGMLVIDVVALLPVIGAIKYSDEVVKLTKRWTKNLDGRIEIAADAVTGFGKKLKGIFDSGVKKVSSATKAIITETKITDGTKKAKEILEGLRKKIFKGGSKTIREQMIETSSANLWRTLDDGTNQGIKHFTDYWEKYPERIPSLAQRLGVSAEDFSNTVSGFESFTKQASKVIKNGIEREVNGKFIYYVEGVVNFKKGVVVIVKDGKIQSMMLSDIKSFNKIQ